MIVLVLGGTRSGKSGVAERLVARCGDVTYIATGRVTDDAMAARVAAHRERRPAHWVTVEAGDDLVGALRAAPAGAVLVDSLGTWVASAPGFVVDAPALCEAIAAHDGTVVVVSEEVGLSVHPTTEVGRAFVDAMGDLNQAVAAIADAAYLVVAGRTVRLGDDA
jgi:adenosyl cobinamide kinase/adenosyl cobinamide phosphate guanylyltransferase